MRPLEPEKRKKTSSIKASVNLFILLTAGLVGCEDAFRQRARIWELGTIGSNHYRAEIWCVPATWYNEQLRIFRNGQELHRFTLRKSLDIAKDCRSLDWKESPREIRLDLERGRVVVTTEIETFYLPFLVTGLLQSKPIWQKCVDQNFGEVAAGP